MKRVIIAAPASGSGKTTLTLGILAALRARGLKVAPFKTGPDFIDPGYHRLVSGRPSINLDGWICPETFVRGTFSHHASGADIAVIEGAMGLFDGIAPCSSAGSTGQIAADLDAPVVLVVDAKGQARSVAALVKGFAGFDPAVRIAGVIFNNVAGEKHAGLLKSAVEAHCPAVRVLGAIPRFTGLEIPSRHLGLVTAEEHPLSEAFIGRLAEVVARHVDLAGMLDLAKTSAVPEASALVKGIAAPLAARIAVARDAAFCFMYEDNLRLLREAGAEILFFSPLEDRALPERINGLYLPGGYPELFTERLSGNSAMLAAIRGAVDGGMPVYAECGGFIYLTRGVEGGCFVGVFPVRTTLLPRRKALGYREVEFLTDTILGRSGTIARGHEFHYSEMEGMPPEIERTCALRREGVDLGREGFRYKNCLASYVHLHFGSNPKMAAAFVDSCRKYQPFD